MNGARCFVILQESLEDAAATAGQVNGMIRLLRDRYTASDNLFRVIIHAERETEQRELLAMIPEPVWFETDSGLVIGADPADGFPQIASWLADLYRTPGGQRRGLFVRRISQYLTPVTTMMLVLNVLYYLAMVILGDPGNSHSLYAMGAMRMGDALEASQWWRLLTSAFMHASIPHLFNNMLVLWYLGIHLEKELGAVRYLILYLGGAVLANVIATLWYLKIGELWVVSVGASGAVFALAGAMLYLVIRARGQYHGVSTRRLMLMIFFTLYHGITEITANVNNAAHLGGLVTGFVLTLVITAGARKRPDHTLS